MAEVSQSEKFWDCICIGTDFDGVIDPVNNYATVLHFEALRDDLLSEFNKLSDAELHAAYCFSYKGKFDQLLDKFCFKNAWEFVQTHFDPAVMPSFKIPTA
jgi:hypothetical protein